MPGGREGASLEVTFVGHSTTRLRFGGASVLTDPFLRPSLGPLARHGAPPGPSALEADVVAISHGHPDHFDLRSLRLLRGRPVLVLPRRLGSRVPAGLASDVIELAAGERVAVGPLRIHAVPARHWISPGAPRAAPLGYVIEATDGGRAYFAGDTGPLETIPDRCTGVDVALLPVWTWGPHRGPGHLGPRSAAELLVRLAPRAAIPIHWGTLYPRHLDRLWRRALTEPGNRFAAHAARLAPGVDVRVLPPGGRSEFDRRDPAPAP